MDDKSFTVPQIESFPISPPLKKSGSTTKESDVSTGFPCRGGRTALSSIFRSISSSKTEAKISLISLPLSSPPLPCFNVIFTIPPLLLPAG